MITITTTPSIEGKKITRYCGIVCGEAILGANLFKDILPAYAIWSVAVLKLTKRNCSAPAILQ